MYEDIFTAIYYGYYETDLGKVAEFLPDHANDVDKYGRSALFYTCKYADSLSPKYITDVVRLLLEAGANPNSGVYNITPLIRFTDSFLNGLFGMNYKNSSCKDTVMLLVKAGADINAQDKNGWTALHKAMRWDTAVEMDLTLRLITLGADCFIKDTKGQTPVDILKKYKDAQQQKIVMDCIQKMGILSKIETVEIPNREW